MNRERRIRPNTKLENARLALQSPSGSGAPMSRTEVADGANAVTARLCAERKTRPRWQGLTAATIGELERGERRWPSAEYRAALTAFFGMSEAELGLYIDRPPRATSAKMLTVGTIYREVDQAAPNALTSFRSPPNQVGDPADLGTVNAGELDVRPTGESQQDPAYIAHWTQMLAVLAAAGNAFGGRGLLNVVSTEVRVIESYASSAPVHIAPSFLSIRARWLEFGSWLADNQGDRRQAAVWLKRASDLADRAHDPVLGAYVVMRRAQRAYEEGEPRTSISLLAGVDTMQLPPRIRALMAIRQAQAHSALGDGPLTMRSLRQAQTDVSSETSSDLSDLTLAAHSTPDYLLAHQGMCLLALGEPNGAADMLESVLKSWPPTQRLDEGLFRGYLALAHARTGALDDAVQQARQALALGVETGSLRTHRVIRQVLSHDLRGASGHEELVDQWAATEHRGGS